MHQGSRTFSHARILSPAKSQPESEVTIGEDRAKLESDRTAR